MEESESADGQHPLDAQMLDAISEAVALPEDARTRAEVISDLVHEIDEVVHWRHEAGGGGEELRSMEQVVEAASEHVARMGEAGDDSEPPPS